MVYNKQTWQNNPPSTATPISAARLNHLETQYDEAISALEPTVSEVDTLSDTVNTGRLSEAELSATIADLTGGGRIVRVMEGEPLPALQDGDLVVRYAVPGNVYSLDFNAGTPGEAVTNLTKISGVDWPITANSTATEGADNAQVLTVTGAGSFYSIPELDGDPYKSDAEILVRYRHSAASQHSLQFYFFGDESYAEGFYVAFTGSSGSEGAAKVRRKSGSSHTDLASVNIPVIASTAWVMMRARCQGDILSFKVWAVGDAEPTEWTVSAPVTTSLPKRAALGRVSNQSAQYLDWIAVATGGKTAVAP